MAATITRGYTFGATEQVTAAKLHSLVDSATISGIIGSEITDNTIPDAKIQSVGGNKFTGLANIPAGAGDIPKANIDGDWDTDGTLAANSDSKLPTQKAIKTYTDGKFNTSTGHDHDNSDSKKVIYTNLDMTGITNGHYLYNNNGTPAGQAITVLSNVIFAWSGVENASTSANVKRGIYYGTSLTPTDPATGYLFITTETEDFYTFLNFRFIKIAGINTITVNARMWCADNTSGREGQLKVDIGGANVTLSPSNTQTPTWATAGTIDVSGLTNGTTYDGVIQLRSKSAGNEIYCSAVILTGS